MEIKEYIEKIIDSKKSEDMEELSDMLEELLYKLKESDINCYNDYKNELYEIAYGKELNQTRACNIIKNMKPYGMHWTFDQTEAVRRSNALVNIKPIDFWVVMNMAYNDYHDLFDENLDMYIKYAKNFISDEDAVVDKIYIYFTEIPKNM